MSTEKQSVEEVLRNKGVIVISTAGYSMSPMLRDRRDALEIHTPAETPKKYDVVLFRKGKQPVLHRIINVTPDGFLIRGDNSVEKDAVKPDDIIGVLYAFTRGGKRYTVKNGRYRIYSRLTVFFHPMKQFLQRIKRKMKRILRCR